MNTTADRIAAAVAAATPAQLANYMALRPLEFYPAATCVAWMDSADRVCGKPATANDTHLCARHSTAARKRLAAAIEHRMAEHAANARG